jgi:hypothetical protein
MSSQAPIDHLGFQKIHEDRPGAGPGSANPIPELAPARELVSLLSPDQVV